MVRRLFCLLAVLAIAGIANADLLAYYDFTDAGGLPTTANEGTAGTAADGILMNGAMVVDIDPSGRGVEHVLRLNYGDGSIHQFMDIGGGTSTGWANWNGAAGNLQPMTVAVWVYADPTTTGNWRTIASHGYERSWQLSTGTGGTAEDQIAWSPHRGVAVWSPIQGTTSIRDGYWHHVVGTVVSDVLAELYIDGVFQASRACWQGVNYSESDVWIGYEPLRTNWDFSWNGMLDNVAIYNNALTAQQILDLYVGTYPPYPPIAPNWLEITGPAETAESSQVQYTAMRHDPYCEECSIDLTEEAIWWVEPETYASIDANGLLTTGNLDTSENITIHAQYTVSDVTLEADMAVDLCCSGDLNDDGKIDLGDYAILAWQWLEAPGAPSADIAPFCSGDGIVDINDLGLFVDQLSGIFNYSASIVYEISDCSMDLSAVEQSGQTRFSVTVEGLYIDFEDTMSANCCPDELELQMTVEDNLMTIYEIEHVTMPCLCICDYPVTARLGPFEPGVYTLEVYEDWGGFIGSTIVVIEP